MIDITEFASNTKGWLWKTAIFLYLMKGIILTSCVTSGFVIFIFLSIFRSANGNFLLKIALASITVATLSVLSFYIYFVAIKRDTGHVVTKAVITPFIALACFVTAVTCTGGCLATCIGFQNNILFIGSILIGLTLASLLLFFLMKKAFISKTVGGILIGFLLIISSLIGYAKHALILPLGGEMGILEIFIIGMIALVLAIIFFSLSKKMLNEYALNSIFTRKQIIGSIIVSCSLTLLLAIPLFLLLTSSAMDLNIFAFLRKRSSSFVLW